MSVAAGSLAPDRPARAGVAPVLVPLVTLAALGVALVDVARRAWTSDDAFISFRYAWQLLEGNGLVYNAGERVEGYTNFLWTMLLAGGMALGADPLLLAQVLGTAFYAGTFLVLWHASRSLGRESGAGSGAAPVLPVAALAFLAHDDLRAFATGGLETSMFTFLATALVVTVIQAASARAWLHAGVLGALAAMTRPDGLLLYALAGAFAVADSWRARRPRIAFAAALPALVVWAPYFVWRYRYYGWPFPNTFYAKSGDLSWWSQGWFYVGTYLACHWALLVALLVVAGRAITARGLAPGWRTRRAPLVILCCAGGYLVYVAKVGGDFMFARFCLPVTPALLLGFELLRVPLRARATTVLLPLLAAAACWWSVRPTGLGTDSMRGLSDEPRTYPPAVTETFRRAGEKLRELFAGTDVRVMVGGTQLAVAYYGRFPYVLEGATGLTDEHLAHLPIRERGRPGHEKGYTRDLAYVQSRRIDLVPLILAPDPSRLAPNDRLGVLRLAILGEIEAPIAAQTRLEVPVAIASYRRELWSRLRGVPGVRFVDFERHLDDYLRTIETKPRAELKADYEAFREFYFRHNEDPAREQPFLQRLRE